MFWLVVLFVVFGAQFSTPYFIGKIIDFLIGYEPGMWITPLYVYVAAAGIISAAAAFIRLHAKRKLSEISYWIYKEVRVQGYRRIVALPLSWHEKQNTGNKIRKVETAAESMIDFIKITSRDVFSLIIAIIGNIIFFSSISGKYAIFIFGYFVVLYAIFFVFLPVTRRLIDKSQKAREKTGGAFYEAVSNILSIKSLKAGEPMAKHVEDVEAKLFDAKLEGTMMGINKWKLMQFAGAISISILLYLLSRDVITGAVTIGSLAVFLGYFRELHNSVTESTNYLDELVEMRNAVLRMLEIYKPKLLASGQLQLGKNWRKLKIENGWFSYKRGGEEFNLDNVSFEVRRGQKIALVGESGSGKSTMAKLLLGLYRLNQGEYTIDGIPFEEYDVESILGRFSIVLQDSELFNFSFEDNVTMKKDIKKKAVNRAVKIAQLEDVVGSLPEGLNTKVGEKGYHLSGGQRQRVGIARAVVMKPELLILDESTSNLDGKTERALMTSLVSELEDCTLVIIAHRLSTVENVDYLYVFDKGSVVEEGSFKDLLSDKSSRFYQMYNSQMSD